ncbi:MAG TPA: sulfotransferase [Hyphomicrobium sp.]|nr:sulfotransferase [Hyphomicrobium sp.]
MNKLVNVFVCGTQKGGTTSLYAHFAEHPQLSNPSQKEIHFFDNEEIDWTSPNYEYLHSFFNADDGPTIRYDVTPIYMFWPPSLERIARYNPRAKLIFLFRDPFERAFSHWCMEWARNWDTLPFAEAIRDGRQRLVSIPPNSREHRVYTYLERCLYGEQVARALALFPRKQLLFIRSKDLHDNYKETLTKISQFLGISPFPDAGPKREFLRPKLAFPSEPTSEDRKLVADFVREDYRRFVSLTGLVVADDQSLAVRRTWPRRLLSYLASNRVPG